MTEMKRYCPNCGAPRSEGARFCEACAHPLTNDFVAGSQTTAEGTSPVMADPANWKVIVGDQLPPPSAVVVNTPVPPQPQWTPVLPPSTQAPQTAYRSLRSPAISQFVATGIEIATSMTTNSGIAQQTLVFRGGLAVLNLLAGLIAGPRRGLASVILMMGSVVLAILQGISLYSCGERMLAAQSVIQGLLPNMATQGLAFCTALRTAFASRK
jgi:hypothetical protein